MNALDSLSCFFRGAEFHFDVNSADNEHSVFRFDLAPHICRKPAAACINLARFQRAPEGSQHSATGSGNDIIQGRGV